MQLKKTGETIEFTDAEAKILKYIIESEIEIAQIDKQPKYEARLKQMNPKKLTYQELWELESGIELEYGS